MSVPGDGLEPLAANDTAVYVKRYNAGITRDEVWRTPIASDTPALIFTAGHDPAYVLGLFATNDLLIMQQRSQGITSLDPTTGTVIDHRQNADVTSDTPSETPGALVGDRFFSRFDRLPPDVQYADIAGDGTFVADFEDLDDLWAPRFPDPVAMFGAGGRVFFSQGPILTDGATIEWSGTLADDVDSFGFVDSEQWLLAVSGDTLRAYTLDGEPIGYVGGGTAVRHAEGYMDDIAMFAPDGAVSWMATSSVVPQPSGPAAAHYQMDTIASTAYLPSGIMHLLDNEELTIHRFDIANEQWLSGLPIPMPARELIAGPANDRLYVLYENEMLTYFDASVTSGTPSEVWFANSPWDPLYVVELGGVLAVYTPQTTSTTQSNVYGADGSVVSSFSVFRRPYVPAYDEAENRLYSLRSPGLDIQSHAINEATGEISDERRSDEESLSDPIRISGDGARVSESRGHILASSDLSLLHDLGRSHVDSVFDGDNNLGTIREHNPGQTILEVWDATDFSLVGSRTTSGSPMRVVFYDGEFWVFAGSPGNGGGIRVSASLASAPDNGTFSTTHDTIGATGLAAR